MPQIDTSSIKQKIIEIINQRGPSLPVHVAKEIEQSILFTSAFLSELLSEKKIKITNMKVGSSPIYYLPGQESQLEKYSHHLKSKEKEAYSLLKEKRVLKDEDQEPSIRVALRAIKDFAVPFRNENILMWRYHSNEKELIPSSSFLPTPKQISQSSSPSTSKSNSESNSESNPESISKTISEKKETDSKLRKSEKDDSKDKTNELDIFDKKSRGKKQIRKKRNNSSKKDEKFFNKVKEYLIRKEMEILDIIEVTRTHLVLKVRKSMKEYLVIAYNKKRIGEEEINKAYKKSSDLNMDYMIISFGDPLKRLENLIEAVKNLKSIEKIK